MNLKKTAITLVIVTASFFIWNQERFTKAPLACEEPIPYVVGAFDRRFGISQKYFLDARSHLGRTFGHGTLYLRAGK